MRRRLFLTGGIGVGKSTAIAAAAGASMHRMGGFLTRRKLDSQGRVLGFTLCRPDGTQERTFLDLSSGAPEIFPEVFETLGADSLSGQALVLDEIGGLELLCPGFVRTLEQTLASDVPILGVLKGPDPANALIKTLDLTDTYRHQAAWLWALLREDPDTMIYSCEKYDEKALALAQQWVREYGLWV